MIEEVPARLILPLIVAPVAVMVPIVALLCALIIFVLAEVVLPLDNSIRSIELLPPLRSTRLVFVVLIVPEFWSIPKVAFALNVSKLLPTDVIVPLLTIASVVELLAKFIILAFVF